MKFKATCIGMKIGNLLKKKVNDIIAEENNVNKF